MKHEAKHVVKSAGRTLTPARIATDEAYARVTTAVSSPRTRNSLERVQRALEHMIETGVRDFSYENVARVVQALHSGQGPKAQSIRNEEGQHFQELIQAYRVAYLDEETTPATQSDVDDLLARIPDQATAARVRELHARVAEMTRRNGYLKEQFSKLAPVDPSVLLGAPAVPTALPPAITPMHQRAVQGFLANVTSTLDCRWEEQSGALLTLSGLQVAGSGFRQALEQIVALGGDSGLARASPRPHTAAEEVDRSGGRRRRRSS